MVKPIRIDDRLRCFFGRGTLADLGFYLFLHCYARHGEEFGQRELGKVVGRSDKTARYRLLNLKRQGWIDYISTPKAGTEILKFRFDWRDLATAEEIKFFLGKGGTLSEFGFYVVLRSQIKHQWFYRTKLAAPLSLSPQTILANLKALERKGFIKLLNRNRLGTKIIEFLPLVDQEIVNAKKR